MTMRDQFIVALTKRGETKVKETFKFIVFSRLSVPGTFYYIGRSGSLRVGKTVQRSFACKDEFKAKLMQEAQ